MRSVLAECFCLFGVEFLVGARGDVGLLNVLLYCCTINLRTCMPTLVPIHIKLILHGVYSQLMCCDI